MSPNVQRKTSPKSIYRKYILATPLALVLNSRAGVGRHRQGGCGPLARRFFCFDHWRDQKSGLTPRKLKNRWWALPWSPREPLLKNSYLRPCCWTVMMQTNAFIPVLPGTQGGRQSSNLTDKRPWINLALCQKTIRAFAPPQFSFYGHGDRFNKNTISHQQEVLAFKTFARSRSFKNTHKYIHV